MGAVGRTDGATAVTGASPPGFLIAAVTAWAAGGSVGWLLARAVPGSGWPSSVAAWGIGLAVATALGEAGARAAARRWPPDERDGAVLASGVGWALASAVGWGIDVRLGGPMSGLAVSRLLSWSGMVAPLAAHATAAAALALGAAGLHAGRVVGAPADLALAIGGVATGAGLGARWRGSEGRGITRVALLVGWSAAWFTAYVLADRIPETALWGYGYSGGEVLLAIVLGGGVTGILTGSARVALWWATAGAVAVAVGVAGDLALRTLRSIALGAAGWDKRYLALSQTAGMALGAMLAAWRSGPDRRR